MGYSLLSMMLMKSKEKGVGHEADQITNCELKILNSVLSGKSSIIRL